MRERGVQGLSQGEDETVGGTEATPNAAATLVGALYQLAADPREWAAFVDSLAVRTGPGGPDPATLAAIAAGSAEVALAAAAQPHAHEPAPAAPRVAVLLVSREGLRIGADAAAASGPLGRLAVSVRENGGAEDFAGAHNRETLRTAQARVAAGGGRPSLVRLEIAGEAQPLFAYAMAAERLPEALREGVQFAGGAAWSAGVVGARGGLAIVAHAAAASVEVAGGLSDAFGLTPAEVRLAMALCEGVSLRGFAEQQGLSVNTARNQLTAVFEKVGVNRQTELVRALSELGQIWSQVEGRGVPDAPASGFAPEVGTVRMSDGRKLAYRVYGPADGRPVLLFHGGIGASLLPPGTDAACHELGLRIVAPERAGVGHSDGAANYDLAAAAQDMATFARELNLSPVQYLAINSGGQAALATAAQAPDSVSRILMLSPRPPSEANARSPNRMVVLQNRLRDHPWMAEAFFNITKHRFTRPLVRQIMLASAVSKGDAAFLSAHPRIVDSIALGMQASLKRGAQGTAAEITAPPSMADLAGLGRTAPVTVWTGAEDDYATPDEVADWLGARIETLTVFDGIGHYLALKHWSEALAWLSGANRG